MTGALSVLVRPATGPVAGTIVLLHGIQGTALAWTEVMARLPAKYAAVAPNLRGRGGSPAPDDPGCYTIEHFGVDVSGMIDLLAGPIWLCGWSMGVLAALAHVRARGTRGLSGLILASGTARPAPDAQWFTGDTVEAIGREAAVRAQSLALTESAPAAAITGAWFAAQKADFTDLLGTIDIPTLVIHGRSDDQCPSAHGRAMAAAIPGARLDMWDDAGHNPMKHDPQRFADAVAGFIASAPAAGNAR